MGADPIISFLSHALCHYSTGRFGLIQKGIHGYTPIMKAIANGHFAVVKEMLNYNCKVTEKVQHQRTLLEWAIENEYCVLIQVRLVCLLIEH